MKTRALIAICWLAWAAPCFAQSAAAAANSIVKADSLNVYSEATESSAVVRAVKKGDSLFVSLELKTGAEKWCSVRLPGESARLGYVECDGLERADHRTGDLALPPDSVPMAGATSIVTGSAPPSTMHLSRARSPIETSSEFEKVSALVVREDVLDGAKIDELDLAAKSGSAAAMTRAALAHYAAADFELAHNDGESAVEHLRIALPLAAKDPNALFAILINLAYDSLFRSEFSASLSYLAHARPIFPKSAVVPQVSGWAYYGLNRFDDAIREWEASQRIDPDPETAVALEKARRDQSFEKEARSAETSHFTLHYQGGATPQLAVEILRTLEEHFRSLQSTLNFTPTEPIGVILYTEQAYRDVTRAPSWSAARNDGRIRIPVQGLASVTDGLSHELKHELTHSFVRQLTLGDCPTWLNEGFAKWMAGERSADSARLLIYAFDQGKAIPLQRLEGSWEEFTTPVAGFAYSWSLAAVESIMAKSGPMTMNRLLASYSTASSSEQALRQNLQIGYADLDRQTAEYLRKTYK